MQGLSTLSRDGIDSVRSAIKEISISGHQKIVKPDMVNPILDKPLLLIIHVIKYELLKNQ